MEFNKKEYKKYAKAHAPKSPILRDAAGAFLIGGIICALGEGLYQVYFRLCALPADESSLYVSVSLIFLSALLTGIGVYDKIAKTAGAGTLVPITGFANAVVSPAIDTKAEGYVLGVGAKIFTVAGPVILYGTLAGVAYGAIYYLLTLLEVL